MKQALRRAAGPLLERAAWRYMAGPRLEDALELARALHDRGYAITLSYWNRADDPAELVVEQAERALDAIAGEALDGYLSVKAPAFGFDSAAATRVAASALSRGVPCWFDAHGPEVADRTLALAREASTGGARVGVALPSRWQRSPGDAERALADGLAVRVVKGQWDDDSAPAEPRAGFLAVIDRAAASGGHVAVATHDGDLARMALARLADGSATRELELLLSLPPRASLRAAEESGTPVRVHLPYGTPSLPYRVLAHSVRRPGVVAFFLRDLLAGPGRRLKRIPPARAR